MDEAIADFTEAIKLSPRFANVYNGRGVTRRLKGDLDQAAADFDLAIEISPNQARAYANRGLVRLLHGKEAEGEKDLEACRKLDASMEDCAPTLSRSEPRGKRQ